jgi:hypothetical protein
MDEITALRELRPVPKPEELEALRGAARQKFMAGSRSTRSARRWRVPALAGGLTAVAGIAAAALVMADGSAVPAQHATGPARAVVTTAWTVSEDTGGTVTIDLRQYANPAGLERTLRADGINAIVRPIPYVLRLRTPFTPPGVPDLKQKAGVQDKAGLRPVRIAFPTCVYAHTNHAPLAVQNAVLTIVKRAIPAHVIIHPGAMPPGAALFLTFLANVSPETGAMSNLALNPVVLNNITVPACVPVAVPGPKQLP